MTFNAERQINFLKYHIVFRLAQVGCLWRLVFLVVSVLDGVDRIGDQLRIHNQI